ncbi:MAG TPA: MoaD/ThiS family protein [Candidatus Limnocylindrales bacterium]|nr:MoaD/ThiS family protein [Candidatus Limnocylindrales bacterium]
MIRIILPAHLKNLAKVTGEVNLELPEPITRDAVLDAIEARYPMLLGTIRDRQTGKRRAFIRFYACEEDLSNEPPETPLPKRVVEGDEPFIILGAMAGG